MSEPGKIRNVALVGHRGTGKTSLLEALLYRAGIVNRLGKIDDGTTVGDWDDEEKRRQLSLSSSLAHIERGGVTFNLIDTPGDSSFQADTIGALRVVETALVVLNTVMGVEVQTERLWNRAADAGLARIVFCNMLDRERADFDACLVALRKAFGHEVAAVQLPIGSEHDFGGVVDVLRMRAFTLDGGKVVEGDVPADLGDRAAELRESLVEVVAETSDELTEKFLMEEEITAAELQEGFAQAVRQARIFPVAVGSATRLAGVDLLLELLALAPAPDVAPARPLVVGDGEESELACAADKPAAAFVFKTVADPFSGHINVFRVVQGTVAADTNLTVARDGHKERLGQLLKQQGKETNQIGKLVAGDIGAVAKLKDVVTGDTLAADSVKGAFPPIDYPSPLMSFAVKAKAKGDEDKVMTALRRLSEEDPMMHVQRDAQTGEMIVAGMSQVHVEVTVERMKRRFHVDVVLKPPRVPYRETIKGSAKAQGKHKKQTGGRGQFADTWMEVSPRSRGDGFEFVNKIVGGAIPRNYIPAVEKGIRGAMAEGHLAGYPVVDVQVRLYDGKHHPVDSSDMAFQIAGSVGFKAAVDKAQPVLLEPIMNVEVTVPEENVGDIIGDMNSRRGRVLGTNPRGSYGVIAAEVPLAEMLSYAPDLTSMTGGRGDYTMEFLRYEEVPAHLTAKIVEQARKEREEAQKGS
jgi:elongation factor G